MRCFIWLTAYGLLTPFYSLRFTCMVYEFMITCMVYAFMISQGTIPILRIQQRGPAVLHPGYGLRLTVYGLWYMVYGLWFTVYGLRFTVCSLRFTVDG